MIRFIDLLGGMARYRCAIAGSPGASTLMSTITGFGTDAVAAASRAETSRYRLRKVRVERQAIPATRSPIMPARFTATENAFEKGVDSIKPAAAVKLIEGWEEALKDAEITGAKGIVADLERLKKALEADKPDAEKIKTLVGKLGEATTKIASHADDKTKDKVAALGKSLSAL